jgi:hypothetical protein
MMMQNNIYYKYHFGQIIKHRIGNRQGIIVDQKLHEVPARINRLYKISWFEKTVLDEWQLEDWIMAMDEQPETISYNPQRSSQ